MKLCVLGSGSAGNCTLVYTGSTALLLDAGFSAKEIEKRLDAVGFDVNRLSGVLVSHEHTDHVRGVKTLSRRYNLPVYLTGGTAKKANGALGEEVSAKLKIIRPEETFLLGDIEIEPFAIPHDSAEPVGFLFTHGQRRAVSLTDVGSVTVRVVEKLRRAHLAVLEANHDPELLQIGPYPWHLKRRISGGQGHLSNDDCMKLLLHAGGSGAAYQNGLEKVIFAHISRTNNNPDLVRVSAQEVFKNGKVKYEIASQQEPGEIHEV